MNFPTRYSDRERVYAAPGSRVHLIYQPVIDDDGVLDLVVTGQEDIYEQIQSHRDSVDINVLLQRFANGDSEALMRAQGTYGDFTTLPSTYAELLNSVIAGEHYFSQLPVEIRAKFGHSFQQWMAAMDDSADFAAKMGWSDSAGASDPSPVSEAEGGTSDES